MATRKIKNHPYGYDMSLSTDLRKNCSSTFGIDIVKDAIIGRILDHNLWYAEDYGIDLIGKIRNQNPSTYQNLSREAETEFLKDDRIQTITVNISNPDASNNVQVTISGESSIGDSFGLVGNLSGLDATDFQFIS